MIEMNHERLSIRQQCTLLRVNRSTLYYKVTDRAEDGQLANEIHEIWMEMPFSPPARRSSIRNSREEGI